MLLNYTISIPALGLDAIVETILIVEGRSEEREWVVLCAVNGCGGVGSMQTVIQDCTRINWSRSQIINLGL